MAEDGSSPALDLSLLGFWTKWEIWCLGLLSFLSFSSSEPWALNLTTIPISVLIPGQVREKPVCFGGASLSLEAPPVCQFWREDEGVQCVGDVTGHLRAPCWELLNTAQKSPGTCLQAAVLLPKAVPVLFPQAAALVSGWYILGTHRKDFPWTSPLWCS